MRGRNHGDFGSYTQWKSGDNVDDTVLRYILDNFHPASMIDIGCGRGKQVESARKMGINAIGVDGSPILPIYDKPYFFLHDYTKGKMDFGEFDLAWSVEFLEHVYEKYMPNFLNTFAQCKSILCTHAVPSQPGTHHVNCQTDEYWINIFEQYGFKQNAKVTAKIREIGDNRFVRATGMYLERYE